MVKTFIINLLLFSSFTYAKEQPSKALQENCLKCHLQQKIPSELIYRRYLMKYSTHSTIKSQLFEYLKNPKRKNSIMPKQFFLKFPQKKPSELNSTLLLESIKEYLDYFDVKKRLKLEK